MVDHHRRQLLIVLHLRTWMPDMAQVTLPYRRHKCPLLRKHEYTQCFLNGKCLRAQKRGVVRSSSFVQRPVFHVYVMLLQMIFWACPAVEEFAEWLRGNLCIPDQEHVDSLILL